MTPARAEDDAFLDVGAGEHRGAGALEREPDLRRAVTVGVGLDDGDDRGERGSEVGGRTTRRRGDRQRSCADGGEIDAGNRRPDRSTSQAEGPTAAGCNSGLGLGLATVTPPLREVLEPRVLLDERQLRRRRSGRCAACR